MYACKLIKQPLPSFPDLEQQIWNTIDEFDGAVFPKFNWSSPRVIDIIHNFKVHNNMK